MGSSGAYGLRKEKSMEAKKYIGSERTTFLVGTDGKNATIFPKMRPEVMPNRGSRRLTIEAEEEVKCYQITESLSAISSSIRRSRASSITST